jgi:hypothetical protein
LSKHRRVVLVLGLPVVVATSLLYWLPKPVALVVCLVDLALAISLLIALVGPDVWQNAVADYRSRRNRD